MGDVSQSGHHSFGAPGVHPDADQLSAFVEHALPAHERNDVLAHLAACRDCRETVAMALPPAEVFERTAVAAAAVMAASPVRVATVRRRPWFIRWSILLPAAAAVAALGLFVAYVSRAPSRALPEQAQNAGPQAPAEVRAPAVAPAVAAPREKEAQRNGSGTPSEKKSVGGNDSTLGANAGRKQPELETGRMAFVAQAPAAASGAAANDQLKARALARVAPGVASGSAGGMLPQAEQQNQVQQLAEQQQLQVQQQQPVQRQGEGGQVAANAAAQVPAQAAPSPAPLPPPAATQTVNVASATAAPIETTSAVMAGEGIAPRAIHGAIFQPSLPSRLSVLSTAAYGSRVLAVDAHNAVFLSTDSGGHWKRVKGGWQGQAVRVTLVVGGGSRLPTGLSAGAAPGGELAGFEARDRSLGNTGNASLTGTVTDRSGAVISRATVMVTDAATRTTRTATTDADGRFAVDGLASGSYEVEVMAPGFLTLHLAGVAVDASHANVANLALEVGASAETVTVEAAGTEVDTGVSAAKQRKAAPPALQPPALFEITTDTGERWTSADGKTWKRD
jgi:hypothetical protein